MVVTQREHLEKQARWRPDETVVYDPQSDEELDYATLNERANRTANVLRARGVRYNDRVALLVRNTVEFPTVLYGCFKLGAVPLALNYRLSVADVAHVLDTVNEQAFVYDSAFAEFATGAASRAGSDATHIVVGNDDDVDSYLDLLAESSADLPPSFQRHPEDISYLFCTSGTTGRPKVVAHSARSGTERVRVSLTESDVTPQSTWLGLIPWFHGSGIDTVVRATVTAGASLVALADYSDPESALWCIREYPVTHVMTVPTLTERFVRDETVDRSDFSAIECWRHTGEVLTERQARTFIDEITPNIFNSYGSSESGINTMLRPSDLPDHAGSVGRPVAGDEIRLVELDSDRFVGPDETVPPGERGEVIVRTTQLFFGYFGDKARTDARVHEGWYYTHDIGVVEDGRLYIEGRTDDMIVSGGELVSAVEVEQALRTHDAVVDAVVVGVPSEDWGERVEAFVEHTEGASADADSLDEYLKRGDDLADYKRPRRYHIVDEIAAPDGKKQRARYREMAEEVATD